jgi:alkylhydroperoxidase family enzyme
MADARSGRSAVPRTAAVLDLATALVDKRGRLGDTDLQAARDAGLSQEEIVETVALNVALDVPVDFTRVSPTR